MLGWVTKIRAPSIVTTFPLKSNSSPYKRTSAINKEEMRLVVTEKRPQMEFAFSIIIFYCMKNEKFATLSHFDGLLIYTVCKIFEKNENNRYYLNIFI